MASFGILANKDKLEAEIAEAKKSVTKQKRIDRELNKVQSGGRVSSFLKREAEKNEVLSASLGIATASGPLAFGQALIKYEDAINRVNVSDELKTEDQLTPKIPAPEGGGGGGGSQCVGLALYVKTVGTAPDTTQQVWVGAGTIAGQLPSNFDETSGKSIASGGSGNVWAEVNINDETGEIVSVAVSGGGATPESTDTSFYYALGYYEYNDGIPAVINYACGSIDVTVCRNWFAVEAPFYGVNMNRCGCNY